MFAAGSGSLMMSALGACFARENISVNYIYELMSQLWFHTQVWKYTEGGGRSQIPCLFNLQQRASCRALWTHEKENPEEPSLCPILSQASGLCNLHIKFYLIGIKAQSQSLSWEECERLSIWNSVFTVNVAVKDGLHCGTPCYEHIHNSNTPTHPPCLC